MSREESNLSRVCCSYFHLQEKVTPFFAACSRGHVEVVKELLLDDRVNINKAAVVSILQLP